MIRVELNDKMLRALDQLAYRTARSCKELVNQALQDYPELQAWHTGKTESGIAAAERGEFAADEDLASIAAKYSRPE